MSWSVTYIGKVDDVARALEGHAEKTWKTPEDQSRKEFEAAVPHLVGLVRQNFQKGKDNEGKDLPPPFIRVEASGHGYTKDGVPTYGQCTAKIETIHGVLVG